MQQPPGFIFSNPIQVCKLNKAICGFKQAPHDWFQKLSNTLSQMGFFSTKSDPSLFTCFQKLSTIFILIYVDDIIVTSSSTTEITSLITSL